MYEKFSKFLTQIDALCVHVYIFLHAYSPCLSLVFWPHVHPAGLLPRSKGSDDVPLATKPDIPGAASAQRRSVPPRIVTSMTCPQTFQISQKVLCLYMF